MLVISKIFNFVRSCVSHAPVREDNGKLNQLFERLSPKNRPILPEQKFYRPSQWTINPENSCKEGEPMKLKLGSSPLSFNQNDFRKILKGEYLKRKDE